MYADYSKYFNPQAMTQAFTQGMSQWMDMNQTMAASQKQMECWKQMGSTWSNCLSTCAEKQMKTAQSFMEQNIECMRELSTAKGVDELMTKQAEWSKKCTEQCQSTAQEMAETMQKTQSECTDIISKMISSTMEWSTKSATSKTATK